MRDEKPCELSEASQRPRARRRLTDAARPALFLVPPVLIALCAIAGVAGHEEPVLDESAYASPAIPDVSELQTIDLPTEKGGTSSFELTLPDEALAGTLRDGTYAGSALCGLGNNENWSPYYIVVEIEVADGSVAAVTDIYGDAEGTAGDGYVYDSVENSLYLERAIKGTGGRFNSGVLEQIQEFLDSGTETGEVDTVSGSTFSVISIVQAYNNAVAAAVAAAAE